MELKVWVDGIQRIVCGVHDKTTCQDVVYALAHATGKTGRFTLIERWRNSERLLAPNEQPLKVLMKWGEHSNDVQFILQWVALDSHSSGSKLAPNQGKSSTPNTSTNGPPKGASDGDNSASGGAKRPQNQNLVKESVPGSSSVGCKTSPVKNLSQDTSHITSPPPYRDPPTPAPAKSLPPYRNPPPPSLSRNSPLQQGSPAMPANSSPNPQDLINGFPSLNISRDQQHQNSPLYAPTRDSPRLYSQLNNNPNETLIQNNTSTETNVGKNHPPPPFGSFDNSRRNLNTKESHNLANGDIHSSSSPSKLQQQNGMVRSQMPSSSSSPPPPKSNSCNINSLNNNNNNNNINMIGSQQPDFRDLVRTVNVQREKLTTQAAELTQYDAEILYWEGKAREQQRNMEVISKEISRLETASTQAESQVQSLSHLEDESEVVRKEAEDLKSELTTLRTDLGGCEQELSQCRARIRLLNDDLHATQQQINQRQEEWMQRESSMLSEIERLKKELELARRETDMVSELSGSLDKEVTFLESNLTEKKRTLERLVYALKEANLQSLSIQAGTAELDQNQQHQRSGSTRRIIGSPRQLENAVATSKNPHGIWV